jgi:hypothetical protein
MELGLRITPKKKATSMPLRCPSRFVPGSVQPHQVNDCRAQTLTMVEDPLEFVVTR